MDSIHGARSATDSSSLTKPIQKSLVVLVYIPVNLVENDSIVVEHGLSSKITQSLGGSSDTSEGSENSGSSKDSGRSDEEYSIDESSSKEEGSETPQTRKSTRESKASVRYSPAAINKEMVSLEKNQTCSLVRLPAGKKASQSLWMFKVKEEWDGRKRLILSIVASDDLHLEQLDVKTTFLHGDLDEDIYMTQLEGFQSAGKEENLVCSDMAEFNKPKCTRVREQGNVSLQCPKLTETNYTTWALIMETILKAYGIWEMIVTKEGEATNEKKDNTSKAIIIQTLPQDMLMQVAEYTTTKEVWNSINVKHLGANLVQKARLQTLRSKLETLKMRPQERGGRGHERNFTKNKSRYGKGTSRGSIDKSKLMCYECDERGHFAKECTKWKYNKTKQEVSHLIYDTDNEPILL
nr:zinc finger, CCHC-type [Tanacetum cinerariifolium]